MRAVLDLDPVLRAADLVRAVPVFRDKPSGSRFNQYQAIKLNWRSALLGSQQVVAWRVTAQNPSGGFLLASPSRDRRNFRLPRRKISRYRGNQHRPRRRTPSVRASRWNGARLLSSCHLKLVGKSWLACGKSSRRQAGSSAGTFFARRSDNAPSPRQLDKPP